MDPSKFVEFELTHKEVDTHNVKRFEFTWKGEGDLQQLPVASCVHIKPHKDSESFRPYTPTAQDKNVLKFAIKEYPGIGVAKQLHELPVGSKVYIRGPLGKYKYTPNMWKQVTMLAAGTGVTPMYQVITEILDNPEDETTIDLIHSCRNESEILLRKDLEELQAQYPDRFKIHYILSAPEDEKSWTGRVGHIDRKLIEEIAPPPSAEKIMILVCGPDPMVQKVSGCIDQKKEQGELSGILKEIGYREDQVFKY